MNVPTMTIGEIEQDKELQKLREENEELKEKCREYDRQIESLNRQAKHNYMLGKIAGLEFSIRCNGVSGNEVKQ